ncbi:MAG: hypothetical protein AVO33_02210 [delta proteobacterium ML8_F1]|nr:MAG: hypothetical protein AVO33_02210 [delta proteobacterium ML8_F1]
MELKDMEAGRVLEHFETLSGIPRCSGDEKRISDYLRSFGEGLGLKSRQDEALNVIIEKPGSDGYEDHPPVLLQGHMDMVCVKEEGSDFDFGVDSLKLVVKDNELRARGTSLGADNGIAVAMILAILEDVTLAHPPLVALFTTEEEVGLKGAARVDGRLIQAGTLINIDSEEEGVFFSSCAGGVQVNFSRAIRRVPASMETAYELKVKGLKGGHSGLEIHHGRGNALKILGTLLYEVSDFIEIHSFSGGEKMNAIPKQAICRFNAGGDLSEMVEAYQRNFLEIYGNVDPDMNLSLKEIPCEKEVYSREDQDRLLKVLWEFNHGVNTLSQDVQGLVESSVNLGVLEESDQGVKIVSSIRSSVKALKEALAENLQTLGESQGFEVTLEGDYPAWPFDPDSRIRPLFLETYEELTGRQGRVAAIHAGLECGLLIDKIPGLDAISLGPNLREVHTPDEALDLKSVSPTFELIKRVLGRL